MDSGYITIIQLLQHHRTGDPAVGLVIIGNMQGRLRPEGIICYDLQMMLSPAQSLYHRRKRRIGIVMGSNLPAVQINLRRMAHPLNSMRTFPEQLISRS